MRITVVGTGYVGLVVGTCFAEAGHFVHCVDVDEAKLARLSAGQSPIYEPGLEELLQKNLAAKRLHFTTDLEGGVARSELVFVAVGTPQGESGDADLKYVLKAAEQIGKAIQKYTIIVNKSTVPVGTAEAVRAEVARNTDAEFDVVSNPEFLKEGSALEDFLKPDRVIIGTNSERARKVLGQLYAPFVRTEHPIIYMDPTSAELTKYASNAMLAARVSFMNDIAILCERVGADVDMVRKGMGADRRIGYPFLFPGCGYGGSCFPKDVRALIAKARDYGIEFDLLRAVEHTNNRMKRVLLWKAIKHYREIAGKTFAVWGLSFKPNTDDMRDAPSIDLIEGLIGKGARVQCHDPISMVPAWRHFGDRILYAPSSYDAAEGADGLFLVTEWAEFRRPDFKHLFKVMRSPVIFDGRNVFKPQEVREEGFTYYGIGRT
jgi:UDPglucose 6-dehydrogenase